MGVEVKPSEIRSTLIAAGINPDVVLEFLEEQVEMCRSTDQADDRNTGQVRVL